MIRAPIYATIITFVTYSMRSRHYQWKSQKCTRESPIIQYKDAILKSKQPYDTFYNPSTSRFRGSFTSDILMLLNEAQECSAGPGELIQWLRASALAEEHSLVSRSYIKWP